MDVGVRELVLSPPIVLRAGYTARLMKYGSFCCAMCGTEMVLSKGSCYVAYQAVGMLSGDTTGRVMDPGYCLQTFAIVLRVCYAMSVLPWHVILRVCYALPGTGIPERDMCPLYAMPTVLRSARCSLMTDALCGLLTAEVAPPIGLLARYAMSAYALATRCPVPTHFEWPVVLRACYAVSGTEIGHAATRYARRERRPPMQVCGTGIAYGARLLRDVRYWHSVWWTYYALCFAMCGTDIAYGASLLFGIQN
eukprot:3940268-Rhodomonas_salina.2